ncbi:MAG TPA: hypothetical protein VFM24_03250 [Nitrospira sp.]|nr:hypothetical protein [Nitrospira sp.]
MDSLEECGIHYLTASSVQQWREQPAVWVMEKLLGIRENRATAVAKTIAVKDGLRHALYAEDAYIGEDIALDVYRRKLLEWRIDPTSEAARSDEDIVLPLYDVHVKEIQRLGLLKKPLATGIASSLLVDGLGTALLAVTDFVFDDAQLRIKCCGRLPSSIQPRDMAALALDARVRGQVPMIVYATPKKLATYVPNGIELDAALDALIADARSLETFVRTAETPMHALAMLPVNTGHYLWKPELQVAASNMLNQWRTQNGALCTEGRGLPEGAARISHLDLLPDDRSGDAESDLEW